MRLLSLSSMLPLAELRTMYHSLNNIKWQSTHTQSSTTLKHQTNTKHQTSNIKHQTLNIKHQTSNIKHQTSNIKHQRETTLNPSLFKPLRNPDGTGWVAARQGQFSPKTGSRPHQWWSRRRCCGSTRGRSKVSSSTADAPMRARGSRGSETQRPRGSMLPTSPSGPPSSCPLV